MNNGSEVAALQRLVRRLRRRIEFIESSRFWKLRASWLALRARLGIVAEDDAPPVPPQEFAESMDSEIAYGRWLFENEPRAADLRRMRELARYLPSKPRIAVVVDDYGTKSVRALEAAADQAYPWSSVVRTGDYSDDRRDWIRFNAALDHCDADVVAFCRPSQVLAPFATFEIALAFNAEPDAVAAYGDRDVLTLDGARREPAFVPDWSPDTFLSWMYTGSLIFYRRPALMRAHGFRDGFGTALHYDLALRVFDEGHVAHRSAVIASESAADATGPERDDGDRAVLAALERRGTGGHILATPCAGVRVVRYAPRPQGLVDVIVPTRDLADKLERCLQSVFERNDGGDFRVTVIDNGSVERTTAKLLAAYVAREPERFRVVRIDEPFNFSRLVNAGAASCTGPLLLFLNNDAQFVSDGGIEAMAEYAARPEIGAVGARLLYADGTVQHAGVVVGLGGLAGHIYRGTARDDADAHPAIAGVRNYTAVTAACMMVRRAAFDASGGFDEGLAVEFNDIDFCMKLAATGLRNLYLPHVVLRHDESSSRGVTKAGSPLAKRERHAFRTRWKSDTFHDPYYNVNLTRLREDATLEL